MKASLQFPDFKKLIVKLLKINKRIDKLQETDGFLDYYNNWAAIVPEVNLIERKLPKKSADNVFNLWNQHVIEKEINFRIHNLYLLLSSKDPSYE